MDNRFNINENNKIKSSCKINKICMVRKLPLYFWKESHMTIGQTEKFEGHLLIPLFLRP